MKFHPYILAMCSLSLAVSAPSAQEAKLPAEAQSSYFNEVSAQLELGGVFYGYADIESDVKLLTTVLDAGLDGVRQQFPIPEKLTALSLLSELGLDSITALGASSRKNGLLFHNRAYLAMPGGAKGILKLLGGPAAPLLVTRLAPANADLVVEEDLNLNVVLEIVTNILKQVEAPDALAALEKGLNEPLQPLPFTVGELVKKLDTKVTFFLSIEAEKKLDFPNAPVAIPEFQAVLALDKMGWLFAELKKMVGESEEFQVQKGEGFEAIQPVQPLPPQFAAFKPVLYFDTKTGRLLLSTSADYLTQALAGETPLANNAEFKQATQGLPTAGNGLSFASKHALLEFTQLFQAVVKQAPLEQREMLGKIYGMLLPKADAAMATVRANLPKGMFFASNSADTHKSTLLTAAIYPAAIMMAGMAPLLQKMQQRAGPGAASENAAPPIPPASKVKPEEKMQNNLEQIAFAAEAYFLDHPKEKEVTCEGLIKGGFLFEVTPLAGENYTELTLKRSGGTLTIRPQNGAAIKHVYEPVSD